jgi:hypothetical protein
MSSSIPQRHSPQFTPAPLPIPTRRPTHRANRSLSSSDDGSLDTQSSTNTNSHLMTQYPYQDSDEDPLRHAYIPLPLSFSLADLVSGLYATHSTSQRPRLAARVISRKLTNSPSSTAPLPSFPPTSSPFTTRLSQTQMRHLYSSPLTSIPFPANSARISRTRATTQRRVMSMFHPRHPSLPLRWGLPYRFPPR